MNLKTLLTVGMMTLAAGLLPAGAEAAAPIATASVPVNASAFAAGSTVQLAPVVVVERRRGYRRNRGRVVRRVYVDRRGRRHVVVRRVY